MRIILVRGTGEPQGRPSMLTATAHSLASLSGGKVVDLPYRAEYGPVPNPLGQAYERSVAEGLGMLDHLAEAGPFILLGYSLGARIAGDFAAGGHRNLIAAGLVADPMDYGTDKAFGIGGRRKIGKSNVFRVAHPRDIICRCPANSPIRTVADATAHLSFATPDEWARDLIDLLARDRWQRVAVDWRNPTSAWRLYSQAIDGVVDYLPRPAGRGFHERYGTDGAGDGRTYLQHLHRALAPYAQGG